MMKINNYWAGNQDNVHVGMCAHQRLKSVCASTQSDQSLSLPPEETLDPCLPIKRPSKILIGLRMCAGWFDSLIGAHANLYITQGTGFLNAGYRCFDVCFWLFMIIVSLIVYESTLQISQIENETCHNKTKEHLRKVSEYDQEIPQSQTADKPTAPWGRAT